MDSVRGRRWAPKLPFEIGLARYDEPPPAVIEDIDALREANAFHQANELRAWIELEGGRIVKYGQSGRAHLGLTRLTVGPGRIAFPHLALPTLRPEPDAGEGQVRFVQTVGGRTAAPVPRRVRGKSLYRIDPATVWTTPALTVRSDGSSEHELLGASPFPRHWLYDRNGRLVQKTGLVDFENWYREAYGLHTPWGDEDSPAVVTAVESALERELGRTIRQDGGRLRRLGEGETLVEQDEPGEEIFLLLDGVLAVEIDGAVVAELGPGAIVGERAALEGRSRTATLRAMTPVKVVATSFDHLDPKALGKLAAGRGSGRAD